MKQYNPTKRSISVKELKDKLNEIPDSFKVLVYIGEIEEYGDLQKLTTYPNGSILDKMPYSKGDKPNSTESFILLVGSLV